MLHLQDDASVRSMESEDPSMAPPEPPVSLAYHTQFTPPLMVLDFVTLICLVLLQILLSNCVNILDFPQYVWPFVSQVL